MRLTKMSFYSFATQVHQDGGQEVHLQVPRLQGGHRVEIVPQPGRIRGAFPGKPPDGRGQGPAVLSGEFHQYLKFSKE